MSKPAVFLLLQVVEELLTPGGAPRDGRKRPLRQWKIALSENACRDDANQKQQKAVFLLQPARSNCVTAP